MKLVISDFLAYVLVKSVVISFFADVILPLTASSVVKLNNSDFLANSDVNSVLREFVAVVITPSNSLTLLASIVSSLTDSLSINALFATKEPVLIISAVIAPA